jgi:hypothetical protein
MRTITYLVILLPLLLVLFDITRPFFGSPYSAFSSPSSPPVANVSGTYVLPKVGFNITFPPGWSGIDLGSTVLVAPTGINPRTGVLNPSTNLTAVYLILARSHINDVLRNADNGNLTRYHEFVNESAKGIGCKVLSDEFVKLNGTSSEKVVGKCGPLDEVSILTYAIASGKNVILIGLKGPTTAFDHNYETFMQSIRTMKINEPSDIEKLISRSNSPD